MPRKRDSTLSEPSSVKRRKLTDNISSESQSPAQPRMTEKEKEKLVHWLDQADKKDGPIFNVVVPAKGHGAKKSSDSTEKPLILGDRIYLEARWAVKPMEKWSQMTKYKKFTVGNQTHSCGDCVLVKPGNDSGPDWKAQVHEVRAADEHHVFLRCTWLENPEELPKEARTMPPYHGRFELVPGNKMDVIDALTVNGPLKVVHWDESNDDAEMPGPGEYFWRQTYNYDTKVLSPLRLICECKQPHNPDHLIVKCSNQACGIWLHASCLAKDVVLRKQQEQGIKAEPGTKGRKQARKSVGKTSGTKTAGDDNGACEEDENTKAELVVPESAAPEMLVTNKKTGDEAKEPVHCLSCKELIQ
ncbi:hypothetical protein D6C80_08059 [Aureobasidium pullulans]|nr:hypothetical protein D6C95_06409 [Aureobasidium pullulans]TIA10481.1 hypothetical protein D6C80_08059 [Aureobasidium pullulans]